jgi:HD-GYP domain-containing protein (c-di-GMP phosphodiesterase class II)
MARSTYSAATLPDEVLFDEDDAALLDHLIAAPVVRSAVYDKDGTLLLAANTEITPQIRRLLEAHQIHGLGEGAIATDDADGGRGHSKPSESLAGSKSESRPRPRIDAGLFSLSNAGAAVRDQIVEHGIRDYDPAQRRRLVKSHQRNMRLLHVMIQAALRRRLMSAEDLLVVSSAYLQELKADTDNVLTVPYPPDSDLTTRLLKVALLAMAIGIEMGFDADNVQKLGVCGLVSDWGMARVPEKIRQAQRQLTPFEFLEIKKHPVHSAEMLEGISGLPEVARLVAYQSHESPNGSGYPRGRHQPRIHPFARIVRVADTYQALVSPRPHRAPLAPHAAIGCLVHEAKTGVVDTDAVFALLRVVSLYPLGSEVRLSDRTVARVLRRNGDDYSHPIVKRVWDADGQRVDHSNPAHIIDLVNAGVTIEPTAEPTAPKADPMLY